MKWLLLGIAFLFSVSAVTASPKARRNVICYFGSWSVYRHGDGKFDVEQIDPFVCTHLIFGFAKFDETANSIAPFDPYNDLYENWGRGAYERFTGLKKINPDLVTLLAIGGWTDGSTKYSQIPRLVTTVGHWNLNIRYHDNWPDTAITAKTPLDRGIRYHDDCKNDCRPWYQMAASHSRRQAFVQSVVPYLKQYGFDGLDMDWEYPTERGGMAEDRENFVTLLEELRVEFDREGFLLTAAVSPSDQVLEGGYDVPALSRLLDIINIMGYDYHGAWESVTGHNAPLYAHPLDDGNLTNFNVNYTVNNWLRNGAAPSKIHLGMPLYGRGWTLNSPAEFGPYAPANTAIMAGPYTQQAGIWGYNEICEKYVNEAGLWTVYRDEYYQAPYAVSGNKWIGFDDFESLAKKLELVDKYGLGGAMVWSIETDDFKQKCHPQPSPLITFINEYLNGAIVRPTTTPCTGPSCTTATPPTTTPPPLTGSPSDNCPNEGYFIIDCDRYYYCQWDGTNWTISYFTCAPGTAPSLSTGGCDWDFNVPGCSK